MNMRQHEIPLVLDFLRQPGVIAVEERDIIAARHVPAGVSGGCRPLIDSEFQHLYPVCAELIAKIPENVERAVPASIVHENHFERTQCLIDDAQQRASYRRCRAIAGDDDANRDRANHNLVGELDAGPKGRLPEHCAPPIKHTSCSALA